MRLATAQAGAVSLHLRGEVANRGKDEATPESAALTAVDLATQDVILHQIVRAMPEVAVDTEEDTAAVAWFPPEDGQRSLVVLDPIDGTLNYSEGRDDYAVMGSLVTDGLTQAAIIHFPVFALTLWGVRGRGCWRVVGTEAPSRVESLVAPARALLTARAPKRWEDRLAALGYEPSRSRCSAVDSTAPVLERAVVACGDGVPDRRGAIGFLITTEAGGCVLLDDRPWQGEDVASLDGPVQRSVVADCVSTAKAVTAAIADAGE